MALGNKISGIPHPYPGVDLEKKIFDKQQATMYTSLYFRYRGFEHDSPLSLNTPIEPTHNDNSNSAESNY